MSTPTQPRTTWVVGRITRDMVVVRVGRNHWKVEPRERDGTPKEAA